MKTIEPNGVKRVHIWVVQETRNSCYDNPITIRDNKEDAFNHFNTRRKELEEYANRNNLLLFDESENWFTLYDRKDNLVRMVVVKHLLLKITDN